jgi:hypothetical protein
MSVGFGGRVARVVTVIYILNFLFSKEVPF